jgi:hypothetical protein
MNHPLCAPAAAGLPPSRHALASYAARRIGAALFARGFEYTADTQALSPLIRAITNALTLHPGDRITSIDVNAHDDEAGRLMVVVESGGGGYLAACLRAVPRTTRRRHEHHRLLNFAHAMADALATEERHRAASARQVLRLITVTTGETT